MRRSKKRISIVSDASTHSANHVSRNTCKARFLKAKWWILGACSTGVPKNSGKKRCAIVLTSLFFRNTSASKEMRWLIWIQTWDGAPTLLVIATFEKVPTKTRTMLFVTTAWQVSVSHVEWNRTLAVNAVKAKKTSSLKSGKRKQEQSIAQSAPSLVTSMKVAIIWLAATAGMNSVFMIYKIVATRTITSVNLYFHAFVGSLVLFRSDMFSAIYRGKESAYPGNFLNAWWLHSAKSISSGNVDCAGS